LPVNTWFNTEHVPLLMGYDGFREVNRYTKAFAVIDTTLPMYYATYHYHTKTGINSMAGAASNNMVATPLT
jgi:hypothetical protein